jgi:hypothetical protein
MTHYPGGRPGSLEYLIFECHALMRDGDNARSIASRLTLTIQRAISGETDFNRRLDYPRLGVA